MSTIPNKIFEQCVSALPSLVGKTYAITGCTTGTGYFAAVAAIQRGATAVYLLNRQSARAREARASLAKLAAETCYVRIGNVTADLSRGARTVIVAVDCDLQSFESVRTAASNVCESIEAAGFGGLDGLVCNAGVMALPDVRTVDGYDVQAQTNHLSHFLLTRLLFAALEAAATVRGEARVVQHSSGARSSTRGMNTDADGVKGMLEAKYFAAAAAGSLGGSSLPACFNRYHQTKLANSVFTQTLHEKLQQRGSYTLMLADNKSKSGRCMVKSLCAEPGVAATALAENLGRGHREDAAGKDAAVDPGTQMGHESVQAMYPAVQSAADGACPLMEAAFGAGAESGDFYMPCDLVQGTQVGMPVKCISAGVPTPSAEHIVKKYEHEMLTMNGQNRLLLWEASEAAVGRWTLGNREKQYASKL